MRPSDSHYSDAQGQSGHGACARPFGADEAICLTVSRRGKVVATVHAVGMEQARAARHSLRRTFPAVEGYQLTVTSEDWSSEQ